MAKLIDFMGRLRPAVLIGLGLVFVLLMGAVDYATGPELTSGLFYLLPVFLVAWFVGARAGFAISVVCAAVWLFDDWLSEVEHSRAVIPWSNMVLELGLFLLFTRVISSLRTAIEHEKAAIQARIEREIQIAQEVQAGLFPRRLPTLPTLECAGACRPAAGVAGDYYDFITPSAGSLFLVVADVSGKGIPAALLMASLQGILRSQTLAGDPAVGATVVRLNRLIFDSTEGAKYATVFLARYDDATRALTYVNAGHNPPLLLRSRSVDGGPDREVERLLTGGMAAGLFAEASYEEGSALLHPGDSVILYTDGLTEALNVREEEFGEARLLTSLRSHSRFSSEELVNRVFADVQAHAGGAPQHDDMTLVIAKAC